MTLIHADQDREVVRREMPVNREGQATGPTVVVYADGTTQPWAYYASCCCCTAREPFFGPADRDAWSEAHRAGHPDHAMQLTAEPWDYRTPPWVAAYGLPLTPPESLMTTDPFSHMPPRFPRPDWDDATLQRVAARQARLKKGCPRHGGTPALTFYKELVVADGTGEVHMPVLATYADGCLVKWRLDVDEEPTYEQAPW